MDIDRFVSHAAPLLELILRTSGKAVLSSSRRSLVSKMRMSPVLVLACTTLGTRMSKASDLRGPWRPWQAAGTGSIEKVPKKLMSLASTTAGREQHQSGVSRCK